MCNEDFLFYFMHSLVCSSSVICLNIDVIIFGIEPFGLETDPVTTGPPGQPSCFHGQILNLIFDITKNIGIRL
jgi:hypothetical protein